MRDADKLKKVATQYFTLFGFNVLSLFGKRPNIEWDIWQNEKQSLDDIEKMNWNNSTGLGAIMGINDLRLFDLDGVENPEIVTMILTELELPEDYTWVVQSGSGEGFHIYIRCILPTPLSPPGRGIFENGEKAVYKFKMKPVSPTESRGEAEGYCKHIELRWKDCQTALPPSNHESGGLYHFMNQDPKEAPIYINAEKVIMCLEKFCIVEEQAKVQVQEQVQVEEKHYYDKEKLESAIEFLSKNLPEGCYEEWYRIGFALVPLNEDGEKYFVEMSLKNPNYHDSEYNIKKKFEELKKDYDGRISLGSLYHIAENYGWKKPIVKFWFKDDKGKLKISVIRLKRFLEGEGYCKYKLDEYQGTGSTFLYLRIVDNVVEEIDMVNIKDFVMHYLATIPVLEFDDTNRSDVMEILMRSTNLMTEKQLLHYLIYRNIEFNKDDSSTGYFYFRNGYAEISKENMIFNEYKKLQGCVWKRQLIRREYTTKMKRSDFEEFIFNICRKDKPRYESLKSSIGYLLHTYKDPSIAKAIIFIDEKMSEAAFGRSGKGLVIKAMSHIKNVVIEDGRNFSLAKSFAFQRVKADTNIIAFEDLRDKFPFERLFSIITEGITIEQKNKDEIFLSYSDSPKVVLSSNFSVPGVDDSTLDRQFVIEFSDYYSKRHKPIDDFGKLFFEGWSDEEWKAFYCFMIECLQFYLKNGLVGYDYVNLDRKKLIDMTSIEFAEFSDELQVETEYDKKDLFEQFKRENEDFDPAFGGTGKLTQGKFTRWLKVWARIKDYEISESKSGAKRTIEFKGGRKAA